MQFLKFLRLALIAQVLGLAAAATPVLAQDIVIGQIGPFTVLPAPDAHEIKQGVQAYVAQANKAGGIRGRKLAYFDVDDKYSPDGFVQAFATAMERKPLALVSPVGSAALTRALKDKLLDNADVVIVNAVPGSETLRNPGHPKLFHVRAGDKQQIEKIVNHARTLGMTKLGALYQDIPVGTSAFADAQAEVAKATGMSISGAKSSTDPAQLAAAAAQVAKAEPQGILVLGAPPFMANGVAALRKAGASQSIFVRSDVPAGLIAKVAGAAGARGVAMAQNFPNPNGISLSLVRDFRAAMEAAHPQIKAYSQFQLEGYISARLIGEALSRSREPVTPAGLQKALHGLKDFDLGGFRVNFGDGQIGSRFVDIAVIGADGRLRY